MRMLSPFGKLINFIMKSMPIVGYGVAGNCPATYLCSICVLPTEESPTVTTLNTFLLGVYYWAAGREGEAESSDIGDLIFCINILN